MYCTTFWCSSTTSPRLIFHLYKCEFRYDKLPSFSIFSIFFSFLSRNKKKSKICSREKGSGGITWQKWDRIRINRRVKSVGAAPGRFSLSPSPFFSLSFWVSNLRLKSQFAQKVHVLSWELLYRALLEIFLAQTVETVQHYLSKLGKNSTYVLL